MTTKYQNHQRNWRCPLCKKRNKVCLFRGKIPARLLLVGEAPGASEDVLGQPFKGPAGHLLNNILEDAGADRVRHALTNLVGCIPKLPDKPSEKLREPPDWAIKACKPRVEQFLAICQPEKIVAVGELASQHLDVDAKILHPAAILRADISQRGLAIQRCTVVLRDLIDEMV